MYANWGIRKVNKLRAPQKLPACGIEIWHTDCNLLPLCFCPIFFSSKLVLVTTLQIRKQMCVYIYEHEGKSGINNSLKLTDWQYFRKSKQKLGLLGIDFKKKSRTKIGRLSCIWNILWLCTVWNYLQLPDTMKAHFAEYTIPSSLH